MSKQTSSKVSQENSIPAYSQYDIESYEGSGLLKFFWFFPWFRRWYVSWINRMLPRVGQITLNRNRVFVFPTARGLLFVICAVCVFIAGTNYSNNLILGTGFLLFSLFMVTIWHSFLNMLGLTIIAGGAEPVFLGEYAQFNLGLKRPEGKPFYALKFKWPNASETMTNVDDDQHKNVKVVIKPQQRGYFYPPRLTVETRFPFGIIRCWSHVALATRCIVYPTPIENDVYLGDGHEGQHGDELNFQSNEEFYELKKYQDGDNLNHVSWKSFSKGLGLRTKHFAGFQDEAIWLDWNNFGSYEHELKLSYICYWLLRFENENRRYGLDIPGVTIQPDVGENHLKLCLNALATFDARNVNEEGVQ